jgi:hypothetical protein
MTPYKYFVISKIRSPSCLLHNRTKQTAKIPCNCTDRLAVYERLFWRGNVTEDLQNSLLPTVPCHRSGLVEESSASQICITQAHWFCTVPWYGSQEEMPQRRKAPELNGLRIGSSVIYVSMPDLFGVRYRNFWRPGGRVVQLCSGTAAFPRDGGASRNSVDHNMGISLPPRHFSLLCRGFADDAVGAKEGD